MLRPYQNDCLKAIHENHQSGISRQLVVMPTGSGKAVVAANVPEYIGMPRHKRLLFLVHRDELVYQAAEKFAKYNPGLTVGIEKAQHRAEDSRVVIASVQSINKPKRLEQFHPDDFAVVMADESHRAANSKQWQFILRYMHVLKGEDDVDDSRLLIGWTATPSRSDSIGLECLYDKLVYHYGIREAIKDGWLAQIVAYRVETEVDLSKIHTVAGDLALNELQSTVNTPARNELIARKYEEICPGQPALFFTVDIQHSHDIAETMRRHGYTVFPISGKTPEQERKKLMALFKSGEIHGLSSCGVFNEGTDMPIAQAGFLCRPTKSGLLYRQTVGRVLRPYPSPEEVAALSNIGLKPRQVKQCAIIVDICDVSGKHSLITSPTLFGLRPDFNAKGKRLLDQVEEIEEIERQHPGYDFRAQQTLDAVRSSLRSVDLLAPPAVPAEVRKVSKLSWLKEAEGAYHLGIPSYGMLSVRQDTLGSFAVFKHDKGIKTLLFVGRDLSEGIARAEQEIPADALRMLRDKASWRKEPPTDSQCRYHWKLSNGLRTNFKSWQDYYQFALGRYNSGDISHSRGSISKKIDHCRAATS